MDRIRAIVRICRQCGASRLFPSQIAAGLLGISRSVAEESVRHIADDSRFTATVEDTDEWEERADSALHEYADMLSLERTAPAASRLADYESAFIEMFCLKGQRSGPDESGESPDDECDDKGAAVKKSLGCETDDDRTKDFDLKRDKDRDSADDGQLREVICDDGEKEFSAHQIPAQVCQPGRFNSEEEELELRRKDNRFLSSLPPSLVTLARRIGRSGSDSTALSGKFLSASRSDISGITVGDNLNALLPTELAMLSCPQTQSVFYRNYASKRLQMFASASSGKNSHMHRDGPVIICLDSSGSMSGTPYRTAKDLTYAVTIIAQRQKRDVLLIVYSSEMKFMKVRNFHAQKNEIRGFLDKPYGGGNDEEMMFDSLFTRILPQEREFSSADILCVSDFGWGMLSEDIRHLIREQKARGLKFYGLNIGTADAADVLGEPMNAVCDEVWCYFDGKCVQK